MTRTVLNNTATSASIHLVSGTFFHNIFNQHSSYLTSMLLLHIFIFTGTGCNDGWTQSGTSCYLFSSQYDVSSWKAAGATCANYQISTSSPTYLARIETNQELVCIETSTKQGLRKYQRYKTKMKFGFITSFHRSHLACCFRQCQKPVRYGG